MNTLIPLYQFGAVEVGVGPVTIMPHQNAIVIVDYVTNQYYGSLSKNPLEYHAIAKGDHGEEKFSKLAIALQRLLKHSNNWRMFAMPTSMRTPFETFLCNNYGMHRVATKKGEAIKEIHILFKVYSQETGVTRFVCAPQSTKPSEIIEKANKVLLAWMEKKGKRYNHQQISFNKVMGMRASTKGYIFEPQSVVSTTQLIANTQHKDFSAVSRKYNNDAIDSYLLWVNQHSWSYQGKF